MKYAAAAVRSGGGLCGGVDLAVSPAVHLNQDMIVLVDEVDMLPVGRQRKGVAPYKSSDPDTERIWWTDAGVHQNLTFPVQPDPVSGSHCWHQKVKVTRAEPQDRYGDVHVDTHESHEVFKRWLALTRPPKGEWRRPHWMLRPFRPDTEAYRFAPPSPAGVSGGSE